VEGFAAGDVRTGSAYEAERAATLARLAAAAGDRRVDLGGNLVLVFESTETVRTALQELLRAERVSDADQVATEAAALAGLAGGDQELVATLYIEVADPVALADRLGALPGIADAVVLEVQGSRVPGESGGAEGAPGAFHLRFAPGSDQRRALLDGADVSVIVDHPGCRATVALSSQQVRAIAAGLRR
jgi:hypothetical protein